MRFGEFGDLVDGEYRIILGNALARKLGVTIGNKVTVIAPQGQSTAAGMVPRLRRFTVTGLFDIGMYEYDSALALVHIGDAARLFRLGDDVSGIRLKLEDVYQAPFTARILSQQLGYDYYVSDWTQEHRNFFRALAVEKRVMFIILFLIIVVAAFNIVSTLVMVVTDKQSDIAILRTLGLTPAGVMGVFFVQGTLVGVIGTLAGGIFGVLTALNVETLVPWLETLFGFKLFPPDIYVITDFPAELHWSDVNTIILVSLCMSMLATLYPALRASRTQPAEALRYE
jgi:lipoprotein-releasing system permease protein